MKNKFIRSTIILVISGAITKIMAMIIKIFLTRSITDDGIGLYMLVLPTFNLFITLCTLSLPTSISKLISENRRSRRVILPLIPVSLGYNFILIIVIFLIAPIIANYLLNNSDTYYPILGIGLTLPFICLSSILKGYFYGKEKMVPYAVANNLEQLVRLILIIFIIPKLIKYGINIAVCGVILINILSEFSSIICLLLFVPNKKIKLSEFKINNEMIKDVLDISVNATGSRLIGSISYFLEPIILTFILTRIGYDSNYIVLEYGIINGYVFPLLLLPSFFTMAISTSLLPVISGSNSRGNYSYSRKKLREAICLSCLIGIVFTALVMSVPDIILKLIYNTDKGINYIRIIAPLFLMHYIQGPLTSCMQAINMAKEAMIGTLMGAIVKNFLLILLPFFLGIWGFIISSVCNILFVTIHHIYYVNKYYSVMIMSR